MANKLPLSVTHPEIAAEADGWDPETATAGSHKKAKWKCIKQHVWEATVSSRARGRGCPFCANKLVWVGFNDLATTYPEIASEIIDIDPRTVLRGTDKVATFECSKGHRYTCSISSRTGKRPNGCPYCSGHKVLEGFNDLETTHPDIAAQLISHDSKSLSKGSHTKATWVCEKGHHYEAKVYERIKGNGCQYCSGHKVLAGFNDLETLYPEVASQIVGVDPKTVTPFSGVVAEWLCTLGHLTKSSIGNKIGTLCGVCSNQQVLAGFNDLGTTDPEMAAWAHGWDPTTVTSGSDKKRLWICPELHKYEKSVLEQTRTRKCPYCSNKLVLTSFNDLATTHPQLAREADGWNPKEVMAGAHKKFNWVCSHGHKWEASMKQRTTQATGCPICSGRKLMSGFNDLMTVAPEIAMQADGWDPSLVLAGSHVKRKWICSEGHRWTAQVSKRAIRGCPSCSVSGFDPNKKGYLYLLERKDSKLLQIGISNSLHNRLSTHRKNGWDVLDIRGPMSGYLAYDTEQAILQYLDGNGIPRGKKAFAKAFDGYTESWPKSYLDSNKIVEIMTLVDEWELSL